MKPGEAESAGTRKLESFRSLTSEILRISGRGLLRRDFLRALCTLLLESTGCDSIELWVRQEGSHYRCSLAAGADAEFRFQRMPFLLEGLQAVHEEPAGGSSDLERLCHLILNDKIELPCEPFTASGSFLCADTRERLILGTVADDEPVSLHLGEGGMEHSLAIIPVTLEEHPIGLLQLRRLDAHAFTDDDVTFLEGISPTIGVALAHQRTQIELRERIKELTCLYNIAQLVAQQDATMEDILTGIVNFLPPGWLYPEIAVARIVLEGRSYSTPHFRECEASMREEIVVRGESLGFIEVAYLEARPTVDEGPFLAEERHLIHNIAREVAYFIDRRRTEDERSLLEEQLRHADRLATIGQLAAGVAHELNEPLGNILGFAQLVQKSDDLGDGTKRDVGKIVSASLQARGIIKKLMMFARQTERQVVPVSLNRIVEEALYFFEARCSKAGITLLRRLQEDLPDILVDPGQINQVLVNLVVNAMQAMPRGGMLTVETGWEGNEVFLIVEDTGTGMSEEVREQVFLPFFTTKDVNEGTGLGLAVVHGIVTSHKGTIRVDSRTGVGAKFTIRLPIRASGENS